MQRNRLQQCKDFAAFPLRALMLIEQDRWGLSSLASERFDYAQREVIGYCLNTGCGRGNRFIKEFLNGNGRSIDVYPYEELAANDLVRDMTRLPFRDATFDSVTFIANINHVPRSLRDRELAEASRCLKPGGNIIVTMGNPLAEILIHQLLRLYDRMLGTRLDVDGERGMHEEEAYYLTDREIITRLRDADFTAIRKTYFATQWGLNHLFVGWKPKSA